MTLTHDTLLIIPTYNEAGNLQRLVEEIQRLQLGVDLLVVDDHSPDGTGALADALAARLPVAVIHRDKKLGIGSAHKAGFQYAMDQGYAYVMTMDADFSHSPDYLRPMRALAASADLVIGSRYVQGGGFDRFGLHRLLLTKTVHWLTQSLLGLPYDCTGGLRLYRVAVLQTLDLGRISSDGHALLFELVYRIKQRGGVIREYPITIQSRREGRSKVSVSELLRAAISLIRLASHHAVAREGGGVS